jgi:hypothetical protein
MENRFEFNRTFTWAVSLSELKNISKGGLCKWDELFYLLKDSQIILYEKVEYVLGLYVCLDVEVNFSY